MGAGGRLYIQISINLVLSHDSTSNSPASPRTVEIWPVRVRRRFPVARSQIFMVRSPKGFSQSVNLSLRNKPRLDELLTCTTGKPLILGLDGKTPHPTQMS